TSIQSGTNAQSGQEEIRRNSRRNNDTKSSRIGMGRHPMWARTDNLSDAGVGMATGHLSQCWRGADVALDATATCTSQCDLRGADCWHFCRPGTAETTWHAAGGLSVACGPVRQAWRY